MAPDGAGIINDQQKNYGAEVKGYNTVRCSLFSPGRPPKKKQKH
jgi:hypothetical protein